jgi:hypothetical protein
MNCFIFKNKKRKDVYRWYIEWTDTTISTLCFEILFASQQNITNEKLLLTGYLASLSQSMDRNVKTLYTNLHIEEKFKTEFENSFLTIVKCPHKDHPEANMTLVETEFIDVLNNHNMALEDRVKSTENVLYIWTSEHRSLPFPQTYKNNCLCGNMESLSLFTSEEDKFKQLDVSFKRTQVLFYEILTESGQKTFSPFFFSFVPILFLVHEYISEIVFETRSHSRVSITLSNKRSDCSILLSVLQRSSS